MPVCLFCSFYSLKVFLRTLDAGCCYWKNEKKITKKTSEQQYFDLYTGLPYVMYAQYISVAVQVTVSFLYGIAFPILFPITLIGLAIMYANERLLLAYYHPQPPKYGKMMNN